MCKIYLAGMNGAPSKTAVIISKVKLENIDWKKQTIKIYNYLKAQQIEFTKMAIIYEKNENVYDYKFIQIKNQNGQIELETNANCGNSMLAVARVVDKIKKDNNSIIIRNIDTALEMKVIKENSGFKAEITSLQGKNTHELIKKQKEVIDNLEVALVNIVNPYIIANAKDFGVTSPEAMLELGDNILEKARNIRKKIAKLYGFDEKSEYPKIALIYEEDESLYARTVYLNKWHKGMPITAAITIAITKVINESNKCKRKPEIVSIKEYKYNILNPKETKKVMITVNEKGNIVKCELLELKPSGEIEEFIYELT